LFLVIVLSPCSQVFLAANLPEDSEIEGKLGLQTAVSILGKEVVETGKRSVVGINCPRVSLTLSFFKELFKFPNFSLNFMNTVILFSLLEPEERSLYIFTPSLKKLFAKTA